MKRISIYRFQVAKEDIRRGVGNDLSGFCSNSDIFLDYNPYLNPNCTETAHDMQELWTSENIEAFFASSVEIGKWVALPVGYLYADYFIMYRDTEKFDFLPIIELYADRVGVDFEGRITRRPEKGTLKEFLDILKKCCANYESLDRREKRRVKKPIAEALELWQAELMKREHERGVRGNSISTRGNKSTGSEYAVAGTSTSISYEEKAKECQIDDKAISLEDILEGWAESFRGGLVVMDDSTLRNCVGSLVKPYLEAFPVNERQAKFEEIASSIPSSQHPERFRALFASVWQEGQE